MFRKKKIGVLGTLNSGKTVLLTSLLWHLKEFSPNTFHVGKQGKAEIKDFNMDDNGSRVFPYNEYTNMLVTEGGWPDKSQDFSIARCTYTRNDDSFWEYDVTFVDIPGERVSDVFIWQANNFADWTNKIKRFWAGDDNMKASMESFEKCIREFEQTSLSFADSWDKLVNEYRNGLIALAGFILLLLPRRHLF